MTLRVAYLVNQYPKVSHSFIRREIQSLERRGVRVDRISIRGWDDPLADSQDLAEREKTRYALKGGFVGLAVSVVVCAVTRPRAFVSTLRLAVLLGWRGDRPLPYYAVYVGEACVIARWLLEADCGHLHAHFGTNSATVAALVSAMSGKPFSFTVHGPEEFDRPQAIKLREKVARAAFVATVSSFGRSQLFRWIRQEDWCKVHVVRCGLDIASWARAGVQDSMRLVCVGRICEQKGQLLLLAAARKVIERNVRFELVFAGDGEMRAEVEALTDRLGLRDQVVVTGWISGERVQEEIRRSRALVLPSFAEGLPVVIMEAMAVGRPVLSTYVAGIPELVVNGESGWLVPAGDVDRLAEAILDCLSAERAVLTAMGESARRRVTERHDVDVEAARLHQLLEQAASS